MITSLHVFLAVTSLLYATVLIAKPILSLIPAYSLTAGTIVSGIVLMLIRPDSALHVCVSGLTYLGVVMAMITIAPRRRANYFTA